MEGLGARLGRSSSRYGTTTSSVFTGPVRKWKKMWVNMPPPNSNQNHTPVKGAGNGSNESSRLLIFKWTPISPSQIRDGNNDEGSYNNDIVNGESNNDDTAAVEEPPKRKFKYIPIAVLEEQNNEFSEQNEDDANAIETDKVEATSKSNEYNEKPDINDVPMEEYQDPEIKASERQDLNESTWDLNLGLKARDSENKSDSKTDQVNDNQLE